MRLNKIFWASFFIIAAVLLLLSQMGYLGGMGFTSIILTILIVAIAIKSIATRNIGVLVFSVAFLSNNIFRAARVRKYNSMASVRCCFFY